MIEKFEDLNFEDAETPEQVEIKIKEKLGLDFTELKQALSNYVISHAEELTHDFVNIAPYGDYSKLLEDNDRMAEFLKTEAHKIENWVILGITPNGLQKNLITFQFNNKSVDDGDIMKGFVYVSFQGKIKHAFAQGE